MATKIYDTGIIELIDGTELYITPLKIRYLREFMEKFEDVKKASGDEEAVSALAECARVAMKQYYPSIKTIDDLEDSVNLPTIYKILDVAAGIKIDADKNDEGVKEQATQSGSSWETLDLAKLESRAFLLGIWKDYEELETSLSMPELIAILESQNEADYQQKKFLAAIQGIDLDEKTGNSNANAWEEMKARVFSGGKTNDPNDITSFQGYKAQQSGFGIGMGLDYTDLTKQ
jgi:hypothetical protein